jgi:hypothetical protein
VAGVGLFLVNHAYVAATSTATCGAGCLTDGSAYLSSDHQVHIVQDLIAAANRSAAARGSRASVVLLDPFTYSTSGTVSQQRITDELRGAYLAQEAANAPAGARPVRLLLANEGTSGEEGAAPAVRQIVSQEGPDAIVAVAGMGLSTASTQTAATALAADGMAMFGAVTTGDQFNGTNYPGFYQVVADVDAQVQRLRAITGNAGDGHVALVASDQAADVYSSDLQTDFKTAFAALPASRVYPFSPASASQQFAAIAMTVCGQPAGDPVVLYAGREAALPALVQQFQQTAVCGQRHVTIVTGSDANALPASATSAQPGTAGAAVTVEYSDIEETSHPIKPFKSGYARFAADSDLLPACQDQPYDPWAAATYNSVMAAAGAAGHSPGSPDKRATLRNAIALEGSAPYPGVSGSFGFNDKGQLSPPDIPVYRDTDGTCALVPAP